MNKKEVLNILTNDAKFETSKQLEISDVDTFCRRVGLDNKTTQEIIHTLEDSNLVKVPKGFASMSPLQKTIHRFINNELLEQLLNKGQAKLIVSEDDLKSLVTEEDKVFVLNKKGDLIKPSCNNTNVTQARLVKKAREHFDRLKVPKNKDNQKEQLQAS